MDIGAVAHRPAGGADDGAVEPLLGVASFVDVPTHCASCGAPVEGAEWPELTAIDGTGKVIKQFRDCGSMILDPCGHSVRP